ncbi:MAG: flagellar biosynthesis anti-sigma factor FlgM [Pirellulaceae bacterium]
MQIFGPTAVHGPQSVNAPHRAQAPQSAPSANSVTGADQLDISSQASYVSQARDLPDIRADRVAEIRQQIASGAYETDEKLDIALDRLLAEIG